MAKRMFFFALFFQTQSLAQNQEVILHHEERFQGGTQLKWQYNRQFDFTNDHGSSFGVIRSAGNQPEDIDFPFPAFNNANGKLGKDFSLTVKVGNNEPRTPTDTALYAGISVQLTGNYKIGLAINGFNRFQAIGMGDSTEALFFNGRYSGAKPSGSFAFTNLGISKKKDSLIFSINDKVIWRQRIEASVISKQLAIADYCYDKAGFYAGFTNSGRFVQPQSFVIDDFELTWLARKGDEMLAEKLLQDELLKYAQFSKPYFGKYIFAKDVDGYKYVLNKYGNKIFERTSDDIQVTSDPNVFIKDEGRNEMYNALGEYLEFGPAKTKALLASAKYPEYLQQQPLLEPLYLVKLDASHNEKTADWTLPMCKPLGIFSSGKNKGVRSINGTIYISPYFDEIKVQKTLGNLAMHSADADEYCFLLKKGNEEWLVPLTNAQDAQLITNQKDVLYCKACHGFGKVAGETRYEPGDYVPEKTERVTSSFDHVYTNVYGQKWKKTYTSSYTKTVQGAYYKPGRKITTTKPCVACNSKGTLKNKQLVLVWDTKTKIYDPRWINK